MKVLFIYNPHAGKAIIKNNLYHIINLLSKDNELTVVATQYKQHAQNYCHDNGYKYDLLVCSGGDGTLNEVINGLLSSNNKIPKLGYIPAGTTNDFASSIKIPKNMVNATKLILQQNTKAYDIGKFNEQYFVYIAAFGAFTNVSYATPQDSKNILGHSAYVLEGLKSLSTIKAKKIKVESKQLNVEDKFIYGMVTNSYSVGGLYKLSRKDTFLDDGLFEVMLIKEPKDIFQLNEITAYLLGTIKESKLIYRFKTDHITFNSKSNIAWTLDGEYGGKLNSVSIDNLKQVINIISK